MRNGYIGFLGGGGFQERLANSLADTGEFHVCAMFLQSPELSPRVLVPEDFRDVLWLCGTLILPDPVCLRGLELNAPLWPVPVDAGQFLGAIGKGVLLLGGEMTPEFRTAAAAREVAVTRLSAAGDWEKYRRDALEALNRARTMAKRPRTILW
jgi:hypothetical protein